MGRGTVSLFCVRKRHSSNPLDTVPRPGAVVIPLRTLPGWLMTIPPSRVNPEIREKILQCRKEWESEFLGNSGLLQNAVGRMAGFDTGVHRKMAVCYRTEPDCMIALSWPHKGASMLTEDSYEFRSEVGHQAGRRRVRLERRRIRTGPGGVPDSSRSSGIKTLNFSRRISVVSASVTRPGTSSLDATHTPASSSQKARISIFFSSAKVFSSMRNFFGHDDYTIAPAPLDTVPRPGADYRAGANNTFKGGHRPDSPADFFVPRLFLPFFQSALSCRVWAEYKTLWGNHARRPLTVVSARRQFLASVHRLTIDQRSLP